MTELSLEEELKEQEDYINSLENELMQTRLARNFLFTTFLAMGYVAVIGATYFLSFLAAIGGSHVADDVGELGTSLLVAGYNLSFATIGLVSLAVAIIGFILIWNRELALMWQKLVIALKGASKELSKDKEE